MSTVESVNVNNEDPTAGNREGLTNSSKKGEHHA